MANTQAKSVKIYSQLSNDQSFPVYAGKKEDGKITSVNKYESSILIKGGANVVNKQTLQTSKFVMTEVSAEDFKLLEASPVYQRMVKRGFLTTETPKEFKEDGAAPLTKEKVKAKNAKVNVTTNEQKPE